MKYLFIPSNVPILKIQYQKPTSTRTKSLYYGRRKIWIEEIESRVRADSAYISVTVGVYHSLKAGAQNTRRARLSRFYLPMCWGAARARDLVCTVRESQGESAELAVSTLVSRGCEPTSGSSSFRNDNGTLWGSSSAARGHADTAAAHLRE